MLTLLEGYNMTTQEMLLEIEAIKLKLKRLPDTCVIERMRLTAAMMALYDSYVFHTEKERRVA